MHVLFVPSYYPSPAQPITGIFFREQCEALFQAGHRVGVLVTPRINVTREFIRAKGLARLRPTTREESPEGFPVHRMHWGWFPRVAPFVVAPLLASAGVHAFKAYCRQHGTPDVSHAFNTFYGGHLAAQIKRRFGTPTVLTEVSSSFLEGLVFLPGQTAIVANTLRTVDARRVCGSSLIPALRKYAPEQPISVLGCIIDTEFFTPATTPTPVKPFIFMVIAQLKERRKGFDVLLQAFARAFSGRTDVELHVRGSGPLRPELDAIIAKLNLASQVKFFGMMSREELRDFIWQRHALISSSYVETFGVSVAEVMACGKPVVVTRSGGPEDFVTERSGIVIPPGNAEALAEALQRLQTHYDDFRPDEVRADCTGQFSRPVIVQHLETMYRQAIERCAPSRRKQ